MTERSPYDGPVAIESFLGWQPEMPRELLGHGILFAGMKLILYARYKSYKSMLAYWAAWRMRDALDVLGIPVHQDGVSSLYLQGEIDDALMWKRAQAMWPNQPQSAVNGNRQSMYIWNTIKFGLKLDTSEGMKILEDKVAALMPLDVLIVDPLYKYVSADITSPAAVQYFQDRLDKLAAKYGIAIWIIAHPRKPPRDGNDGDGSVDDLLGSSTWANWADTVLKVYRPQNQAQDVFILKNEGVARHAEEEIKDVVYRFDRKTLTFHTTLLT